PQSGRVRKSSTNHRQVSQSGRDSRRRPWHLRSPNGSQSAGSLRHTSHSSSSLASIVCSSKWQISGTTASTPSGGCYGCSQKSRENWTAGSRSHATPHALSHLWSALVRRSLARTWVISQRQMNSFGSASGQGPSITPVAGELILKPVL